MGRRYCWMFGFALAVTFLRADIVRLKNGNTLEGKAERLEDGSVKLELDGGGVVVLNPGQVESVESGPTARERYLAKKKSLSPQDAAGRFALARWCLSKGLKKEAEAEFREVLELNPDHEGARKALGYVRDGEGWITKAEYHRRRGEELFEGRWIPSKEKEKILAERAARRRRTALLRVLRRAASGGSRAPEAIKALRAVPARDLVPVLLQGLRRSTRERIFAARELSGFRLKGKEKFKAVESLTRLVVTGSTGKVRRAALDSLKAIKWSETPIFFCRYLYDSDRLRRIFALQALIEFPDLRAVGHIFATFPLSWQGGTSGTILAGVSASYIRGYELVSGGTGSRIVEIAKPKIGTVVVGSGIGTSAGGATSEDRKRRAEAFLRFRALEVITGEPYGTSLKAWKRWWRSEGRALIAAKLRAEKEMREAAKRRGREKREKEEEAPGKIGPPPPLPD